MGNAWTKRPYSTSFAQTQCDLRAQKDCIDNLPALGIFRLMRRIFETGCFGQFTALRNKFPHTHVVLRYNIRTTDGNCAH